MKHPNKLLSTISSNYHVNTRKICFPNGRLVAMFLINELGTKFCKIWSKLMKLHRKRPVLTSQFDVRKLQKQLRSVIQIHLEQSANFGPLSTNAWDNKPLHNSLKVTQNATNWNNYINKASKRNFANIFFILSYNTHRVCFFQREDLFHCLHNTNWRRIFWFGLNKTIETVRRTTSITFPIWC